MSAPGALSFAREAWEQVLSKARRAVVYLDAACAESLHWSCGPRRLLEAAGGPACELRGFGPDAAGGGPGQPKALFVLSGLLKGRTLESLRAILGRSHFQHCVVVTAVGHPAHLTASHLPAGAAAELEGRQPVFEQLEEKLCEWMGSVSCTAEVLHAPLLLAPLAPHLALTPAFASLFPLLPRDLKLLNGSRPDKRQLGSLADVDASALTPELLLRIRCLVSGLSAFCEHLGVREECFSVGALSRVLAADLAGYAPAKARRKAATGRASVVFVDRTLDLTGAVGHHGDNLVEKMISFLPKLPGHTNDVMVNMIELTALQPKEENYTMIAPGCLAQSNDTPARALWESLLTTKHKEALMEVRRHLVEAASRENLPIKMNMGRVTSGQLTSYIQLFKKNLRALENHCGLLQLGLATAQTLKHPFFAKWDNFLAFERLLLQSIGESSMSNVLHQVLPIIKSFSQRTSDDYSPEDLLILLVYIYSVVGEIPANKDLNAAEEMVKMALTVAFSEEPKLSPLLQKILGCESTGNLTFQQIREAVEEIFDSLHDIMAARSLMKQFKSVYIPGNHTHQATYKPLLKQIVEEILNPERPDPVDIEHMSSGLTDLLKTGFSMFMKREFINIFLEKWGLPRAEGESLEEEDETVVKSESDQTRVLPHVLLPVSRPHPGDHPLLILFVVGGVTISEAKMVKDLVSSLKPGTQVIVLSTQLLKPLNIPEQLFASDRLHPDIGI